MCVIIRQVRLFSLTMLFVSVRTFSAVAGSSAAVCSSRSKSCGGTIVATGTPEEVAQNPHSFTGQYLRPVLERAAELQSQK